MLPWRTVLSGLSFVTTTISPSSTRTISQSLSLVTVRSPSETNGNRYVPASPISVVSSSRDKPSKERVTPV